MKLPRVSGGKREIIMVYLENSALPSQSHSTSAPTQVMTQDGNRPYKLIFHIPYKPLSYSWLPSLTYSSPQAIRIPALCYVFS